jgi:hypothetical protein
VTSFYGIIQSIFALALARHAPTQSSPVKLRMKKLQYTACRAHRALLAACLAYSSALKTKAIQTFERPLNIYQHYDALLMSHRSHMGGEMVSKSAEVEPSVEIKTGFQAAGEIHKLINFIWY